MTSSAPIAHRIARMLDTARPTVAAETAEVLGRLVDEMPSTVSVEVLREALDLSTSTRRRTPPSPPHRQPPPWTPDRPAMGASRPPSDA